MRALYVVCAALMTWAVVGRVVVLAGRGNGLSVLVSVGALTGVAVLCGQVMRRA